MFINKLFEKQLSSRKKIPAYCAVNQDNLMHTVDKKLN